MGWMWGTFFLLGMSTGFYVPALTNIITARGLDSGFVQWAWLAGPVTSLLSPVCVGALADNRFAAQRVLGWIGLASALLLAGSFAALDLGWPPWWFIGLLFASSIVAAPMWSMMSSLSMAHLKSGEREFPLVRLGGTVGWMVAGYLTSFLLHADASPVAGYAGAVARTAGGVAAFYLPHTPPLGNSRSVRTLLGLNAFRLLKERDHCVFFVTTALLSIPLAAFYMWTPRHLADLGDARETATMAIGQFSEIVAMLVMASLLVRLRVKTLLLLALGLSAVRYGLFAYGGLSGMRGWLVAGISLHGMCYTFYFITAQLYLDRRVPVEMRSQAQGLLSLFSNGIGSLIGTIAVRALYDSSVAGGAGGWPVFWGVLGGAVALITVGFAVAYVGVPTARRDASG